MHTSSLIADVATDAASADGVSPGVIIAIVAAVAVALVAVGLLMKRNKRNSGN